MNYGVSGGPTINERDILMKYIGIVDPDLIVVGFCLNDPQPKSQNYSIEREKLDRSIIGFPFKIVSRIFHEVGLPYMNNVINKAFYGLAEKMDVIPSWQTALQRTYEPSSNDWYEFVQALREIKEMSDMQGLPDPIFAILNQGTSNVGPTDYNNPNETLKQYLHWYHQAEEAAGSAGFRVYNHEKEIASRLINESLSVNIHDGHPSANLNKIYGEKLYQTIMQYYQ